MNKKSLKPRKKPKQDRSQLTQQQILEAAARLWNKGTGHSVTTNHIAKATGISVGTLYKYYPNKESILCDVARQLMEEDIQLVNRHASSFDEIFNAMIAVHKTETHLRAFVYQNLSRLKLLDEAIQTRKQILNDSLLPSRKVDPAKMWIAMNSINGIIHATAQLPIQAQDWTYAKKVASLVFSTLA